MVPRMIRVGSTPTTLLPVGRYINSAPRTHREWSFGGIREHIILTERFR